MLLSFWVLSLDFLCFIIVPEYDVVTPYQLDETGSPLPVGKRLQSLSQEPREKLLYKVSTFGKELHLDLKLNRKLMSPNLVMEKRHANGKVSYISVPKNTCYIGHVKSDPNSMVAVSHDSGLAGLVISV